MKNYPLVAPKRYFLVSDMSIADLLALHIRVFALEGHAVDIPTMVDFIIDYYKVSTLEKALPVFRNFVMYHCRTNSITPEVEDRIKEILFFYEQAVIPSYDGSAADEGNVMEFHRGLLEEKMGVASDMDTYEFMFQMYRVHSLQKVVVKFQKYLKDNLRTDRITDEVKEHFQLINLAGDYLDILTERKVETKPSIETEDTFEGKPRPEYDLSGEILQWKFFKLHEGLLHRYNDENGLTGKVDVLKVAEVFGPIYGGQDTIAIYENFVNFIWHHFKAQEITPKLAEQLYGLFFWEGGKITTREGVAKEKSTDLEGFNQCNSENNPLEKTVTVKPTPTTQEVTTGTKVQPTVDSEGDSKDAHERFLALFS